MSLIQLVLPIAAGLLLAVVLQALVSPGRVTAVSPPIHCRVTCSEQNIGEGLNAGFRKPRIPSQVGKKPWGKPEMF